MSRIGDFDAGPVELPDTVEGGGGATLVLLEADPPRSGRSFWADYQRYRGVLRVPGRRPRRLPVEIELAPWSPGRTEVGLRFARRLRPEGNRPVFDAASQAIDALVHRLEGRASPAER